MKASAVVSSVGFNYLGQIVAVLAGFVTTPIILHGLGSESYGTWAVISALIGYSALLDMGVGLTVMRLVAERAHLPDRTPLRQVASTGLVLYSALGILVLVVGLVVAPFLAQGFGLRGDLAAQFEIAFMIIVATVGLTFPAGLYSGLNQGMGRFRQQNLIVVFQFVSIAITSIVIVSVGGKLPALAIGSAACVVATFIVKIVYAIRSYGIYPDPRLASKPVAREIASISGWVFVSNVTNRVVWDADTVVLGVVLNTVAVAHYVVALGPATAVRRLSEQFNTVALTAASSLRAQDDEEGVRRLLGEGTRVSLALAIPFLAVMAAWGERFLSLWVGPSFADSAAVLVVLLMAIVFAALQSVAAMVLLASHRQRALALVSVVEAVANLGLSIFLAYRIGLIGVAIGTLVPILCTTVLYYIPTASREVGYPIRRYVGRAAPILGINALACGLLQLLPARHLGSLPLFAVVAGPIVVVLALLGLLSDRTERQTYLSMIRNVVRAIRPSSAAPASEEANKDPQAPVSNKAPAVHERPDE